MSPLFKVGSIIMLAVMQAAFALEVGNLKTQAYRNPIGIDVATPYFGWILASDERGVVQESYEIRVATDRDFQNVVWQSGKVCSSQSVDVLAQGFTTSPRTRYYWQVTVTDNKGDEATSTERAYFETGVGNDPVWSSARWIKVGGNAMAMACGKTVTFSPVRATPCSASFHQL